MLNELQLKEVFTLNYLCEQTRQFFWTASKHDLNHKQNISKLILKFIS